MLSRIADSLFWLNRYMERADGLLRSAYVHYILSLDRSVNYPLTWKPVLEIFSHCTPEEIASLESNANAVLKKLLIDEGNSNSLKSLINKARENARGVQDHITKEVWESVNQLYHLIHEPGVEEKMQTDEAIKMVELLMRHTVYYAGITDITMARGIGWNFMNLGKFIERCLQTIILTDKQLELISASEQESGDILQWRYLLLSLSGYEMHLKSYRTQDHNYNVLHQIVMNENFTRSILYSLTRIHYYLEHIMDDETDQSSSLVRCLGRLYSRVKYMELETLNGLTLQRFIHEVRGELFSFNTLLGQQYFSYS